MKINWGTGIAIAMGLFMSFIVFLVVNLMSKRVDLESEDYYKKEINYESEIAELKNGQLINQSVKILSQEEFLVVQLADSVHYSNVELHLIRPNDQRQDKSYQIKNTHTFLVPKKELLKGNYKVEIRYVVNDKKCLQKETILI